MIKVSLKLVPSAPKVISHEHARQWAPLLQLTIASATMSGCSPPSPAPPSAAAEAVGTRKEWGGSDMLQHASTCTAHCTPAVSHQPTCRSVQPILLDLPLAGVRPTVLAAPLCCLVRRRRLISHGAGPHGDHLRTAGGGV